LEKECKVRQLVEDRVTLLEERCAATGAPFAEHGGPSLEEADCLYTKTISLLEEERRTRDQQEDALILRAQLAVQQQAVSLRTESLDQEIAARCRQLEASLRHRIEDVLAQERAKNAEAAVVASRATAEVVEAAVQKMAIDADTRADERFNNGLSQFTARLFEQVEHDIEAAVKQINFEVTARQELTSQVDELSSLVQTLDAERQCRLERQRERQELVERNKSERAPPANKTPDRRLSKIGGRTSTATDVLRENIKRPSDAGFRVR
jgi:hypothetical protein